MQIADAYLFNKCLKTLIKKYFYGNSSKTDHVIYILPKQYPEHHGPFLMTQIHHYKHNHRCLQLWELLVWGKGEVKAYSK